jgi:hypothetical protein
VLMEPADTDKDEVEDENITKLVADFQDQFVAPKSLPPSGAFDHHIPLLPGSVSMNSRLYRYVSAFRDRGSLSRRVSVLRAPAQMGRARGRARRGERRGGRSRA